VIEDIQQQHKLCGGFLLSGTVRMTVIAGIKGKIVIRRTNMLNFAVVPAVMIVRSSQHIVVIEYRDIVMSVSD